MQLRLMFIAMLLPILFATSGGCSKDREEALIDRLIALPTRRAEVYARGGPPQADDAYSQLVSARDRAIPALLRHLDDRQVVVPEQEALTFAVTMTPRYDANLRNTTLVSSAGVPAVSLDLRKIPPITVGDIAFAALGRIVNRNFRVWLLSSEGSLLVNDLRPGSAVIDLARGEWSTIDAKGLERSLRLDVIQPDTDQRLVGALAALLTYSNGAAEGALSERVHNVRSESGREKAMEYLKQLVEIARALKQPATEQLLENELHREVQS